MIGDSKDETSFPHKLLLPDIEVSKLCKTFLDNSSAIIKSEIVQLLS